MKLPVPRMFCQLVWLSVFGIVLLGDAAAHGETDWNDFKIDNKNDSVATNIQHVRQLISDVVLGRREVSEWPALELLRARDELAHLQEEMDGLLKHFNEEGVYVQLDTSLRKHPRAGRSVAASHAIEIAIELLEHIASLDGPTAFEEELHVGGIGVYMFDLMDSYTDQMDLWAQLVENQDTK